MTGTLKTKTIAGHELTLVAGREYRASRPMADGRTRFDVTITDITGDHADGAEIVIPSLTYDAANNLLTAFNNAETSFAGRTW